MESIHVLLIVLTVIIVLPFLLYVECNLKQGNYKPLSKLLLMIAIIALIGAVVGFLNAPEYGVIGLIASAVFYVNSVRYKKK